MRALLLLLPALAAVAVAQKNPHWVGGRNTIVHLFEWKFSDIAAECERFLGPMGYAGVQTSPVNEYLSLPYNNPSHPWWERYQPVSYNIISRSGNEDQFADMVRRCNNVGVRIYVDVTFNDMCAAAFGNAVGIGGDVPDPSNKRYPAVPYGPDNFHSTCPVNNYQNGDNVRQCELDGLRDLDQSQPYVRQKIVEHLNRLVSHGVAGFRVDAAKHMYPSDLQAIYGAVNDLSTEFFPSGTRPFFYQEVIDITGTEAVKSSEYTGFGVVTEFKYGAKLSDAFLGNNPIHWLKNWGTGWGLLPSDSALAFIDNHDNQRNNGGGGDILTYKRAKLYKMAISFMLAWPYGITRVMSSYYFDNNNAGPPSDGNGNILDVSINSDNTCGNGWVCEHRWSQIYNMVGFRNTVEGTSVTNWWDNGNQQIAFGRGNAGFVAFNDQYNTDFKQTLQTGLPQGDYCDLISGSKSNGRCTGKSVTVNGDGSAYIEILSSENDGALAISRDSKL
ncbi:hypothetical protein R5R35_003133 [Gryllus longicercus]|uniref:Alpha-amylase n=1 Tax=Gryllus longicercus TaxID=2509291 RepID=A0AAN9Z4S8_9ORTH